MNEAHPFSPEDQLVFQTAESSFLFKEDQNGGPVFSFSGAFITRPTNLHDFHRWVQRWTDPPHTSEGISPHLPYRIGPRFVIDEDVDHMIANRPKGKPRDVSFGPWKQEGQRQQEKQERQRWEAWSKLYLFCEKWRAEVECHPRIPTNAIADAFDLLSLHEESPSPDPHLSAPPSPSRWRTVYSLVCPDVDQVPKGRLRRMFHPTDARSLIDKDDCREIRRKNRSFLNSFFFGLILVHQSGSLSLDSEAERETFENALVFLFMLLFGSSASSFSHMPLDPDDMDGKDDGEKGADERDSDIEVSVENGLVFLFRMGYFEIVRNLVSFFSPFSPFRDLSPLTVTPLERWLVQQQQDKQGITEHHAFRNLKWGWKWNAFGARYDHLEHFCNVMLQIICDKTLAMDANDFLVAKRFYDGKVRSHVLTQHCVYPFELALFFFLSDHGLGEMETHLQLQLEKDGGRNESPSCHVWSTADALLALTQLLRLSAEHLVGAGLPVLEETWEERKKELSQFLCAFFFRPKYMRDKYALGNSSSSSPLWVQRSSLLFIMLKNLPNTENVRDYVSLLLCAMQEHQGEHQGTVLPPVGASPALPITPPVRFQMERDLEQCMVAAMDVGTTTVTWEDLLDVFAVELSIQFKEDRDVQRIPQHPVFPLLEAYGLLARNLRSTHDTSIEKKRNWLGLVHQVRQLDRRLSLETASSLQTVVMHRSRDDLVAQLHDTRLKMVQKEFSNVYNGLRKRKVDYVGKTFDSFMEKKTKLLRHFLAEDGLVFWRRKIVEQLIRSTPFSFLPDEDDFDTPEKEKWSSKYSRTIKFQKFTDAALHQWSPSQNYEAFLPVWSEVLLVFPKPYDERSWEDMDSREFGSDVQWMLQLLLRYHTVLFAQLPGLANGTMHQRCAEKTKEEMVDVLKGRDRLIIALWVIAFQVSVDDFCFLWSRLHEVPWWISTLFSIVYDSENSVAFSFKFIIRSIIASLDQADPGRIREHVQKKIREKEVSTFDALLGGLPADFQTKMNHMTAYRLLETDRKELVDFSLLGWEHWDDYLKSLVREDYSVTDVQKANLFQLAQKTDVITMKQPNLGEPLFLCPNGHGNRMDHLIEILKEKCNKFQWFEQFESIKESILADWKCPLCGVYLAPPCQCRWFHFDPRYFGNPDQSPWLVMDEEMGVYRRVPTVDEQTGQKTGTFQSMWVMRNDHPPLPQREGYPYLKASDITPTSLQMMEELEGRLQVKKDSRMRRDVEGEKGGKRKEEEETEERNERSNKRRRRR